jgi:hypothetical protein
VTDQDPELRELLASARDGMSPTLRDTERVRVRLSSALGTAGDVESSPPASPNAAARALRWTRLRWLALGLGAGGLAGYAVGQLHVAELHSGVPASVVGLQASEAAPRVVEAAPAPLPPVTEAPVEALPEGSGAAPSARVDAGHAARTPRRERRAPVVQGPDEVALMQRVNRALARGEAAWALSLLRQLDLEIPHGRLLEERAAGGAIARCLLDPRVAASELARYAERHPNSVHLPRVSQVCTPPGRE